MNPRWMRMIWIAPLAILGILALIAIGGGLVMVLWNWLAPTLFGWREINFWQAFGLLVLCRLLFGGFRLSGNHSRSEARRRITERVAERVAERWEHLTPEEREKYRRLFFERWGRTSPPDSKPNE